MRERGEEEEEEEEEVVSSLILDVKYKTILCPAMLLADWKEVILHSVFLNRNNELNSKDVKGIRPYNQTEGENHFPAVNSIRQIPQEPICT